MRWTSLLFACLALLTAACAEGLPTDAAIEDTVDAPIPTKARVSAEAIRVDAEWRSVSAGTPTYGYDPRAEILRIAVQVDDAAIRAQHPGFDGLESVFVLVPRATDGGLVWESHAVPYWAESRAGYYAQIVIDVHRTDWLHGLDVQAAIEHGVAIGLDTNVGTVWAQGPGENHPVVRAR